MRNEYFSTAFWFAQQWESYKQQRIVYAQHCTEYTQHRAAFPQHTPAICNFPLHLIVYLRQQALHLLLDD